ncbi:MAG: Bax inhibitor-1/YccA family protein [Ignavibacteriales bacterium]|nr:Bax inhibitor-1/YccA family protein [Ignavibacteriales bacterium]
MEEYNIEYKTLSQDIIKVQQAFLSRVYGWMMLGLLLTAGMAMYTVTNEALLSFIFSSRITYFGLIFLQLGMVIYLSVRVQKMQAITATVIFIAYSILTGLTLSVIFMVYTAGSIASTFLTTALMFGAMAMYGYFTKRDLTGVGSFMMMGLFGMVIASVVNIFLGSENVSWIVSFIGVIVFTGLTAYDTQKMKSMAYVMMEGHETARKGAIMGALTLYLDFINLFLSLLRLFGDRK